MTIRSIEPSSAGAVAKLMSTIKPDWWDFEGAHQQLQDVGLLAKLVGWYLEEDGAPRGWLLCAEYEGYSCLTIENLGYDEDGSFVMEKPLERCCAGPRRTPGRRACAICGTSSAPPICPATGTPSPILPGNCAPCALWGGRILTISAPSVLCPPGLSPTATGRIITASS